MSTALAPRNAGPVTLRSLVNKPEYQARFKEVLGDKAQQFCTSLINVGNTMQDVEPNSVIQSAMIAAGLDLPIDKNLGFAWVVPYKRGDGPKLAQFQMGYKGYIQLAFRTGQYKRMNARAVNEGVFVKWDEVGEPIIDWDKLDESKPPVGYVFGFQLTNGFTKVCYWPKKRIEEHAKRYSQAYRKGYESPWKSHFDEMALKTVIKNELAKWGIMSIQIAEASEKDQGVVDVDGKVSFLDIQATPASPEFNSPPPPLLGGNTSAVGDDGDVAPQPTAPTPPPATSSSQPEETSKTMNIRLLTEAGVTFDDFRDFVATKRLKGHADASTWASYDEVPDETYVAMTARTTADCIKTFGTKK